jgi:uncharacterized membrane protein
VDHTDASLSRSFAEGKANVKSASGGEQAAVIGRRRTFLPLIASSSAKVLNDGVVGQHSGETDAGGARLPCPACRAIDLADGVEDGNLFPVLAKRVAHERKVVQALVDAQDRVADRITAFAGSLNFVYIHTVWFAVWILLNVGALGAALTFDKFPFGLLTMIVSLEAIFLSTFVMVSQNRQAERADIRSQLDFETNLRAEIWSVHIGHALGVDADHVEQVVRRAIEGSKQQMTG